MLVRQVISRFEFELTPEIIKRAAESGTSFRQQIQMSEECEEGHEGAIKGLPGQTVHLEKFSDALIKLFVTVYKPEGLDICASTQTDVQTNKSRPSQTDIKLLSDNEAQTIIKTFAETDMQTDIRCYADTDMQTDKLLCKNIRLQTDRPVVGEIDTQTEIQAYTDTCIQTDKSSNHRASTQTEIHEYKESEMQTEKNKVKNGGVQTVILEYRECNMQTDIKEYLEAISQTDKESGVEAESQTIEMRVNEQKTSIECETECNMSTQVDCAVMATVKRREAGQQATPECGEAVSQTDRCEMKEAGMQAVAQAVQCKTQTDISMALQSDGCVQATVSISEIDIQTEQQSIQETESQTIEMRVNEQMSCVTCETDCNMSTQVDSSMQSDVQASFDQSSQAVSDMCDGLSQTAADTSSQHVQTTDQSVNESFTQTNEILLQAASTQSDANISSSAETVGEALAAAISGAPEGVDAAPSCSETSIVSALSEHDTTLAHPGNDISFDTSIFGASFADVQTPEKRRALEVVTRENTAQTDPVTIIIGDASFLLKKLKGSASSPSKVTTTGNEIEIEVNVEQPEQQKLQHVNNVPLHPNIPPQQSGYTQGGQNSAWNSGPGAIASPGVVRVRGAVPQVRGAAVGPRVRMPVATPAQQPRQVVAQPQRVQLGAGGSQPTTGGNFSCPFCSFTFIDSPALYEHLSVYHTLDQKSTWSQPKGRQGKTIIPQSQKNKLKEEQAAAAKRKSKEGGHSVGLFEDPEASDNVSPTEGGDGAVKKRRGRPPGAGKGGRGYRADLDSDTSPPPAKRANISI